MVDAAAVTLMSIAFGMGLGLEVKDFNRLATAPRPVLVGLCGQILLLPLVATMLASLVVAPELAAGLLLMGVCPGGSSSNYFSFLARGNIALSVSLTALTGMLSVLYVPLTFNFAANLILGAETEVALPVWRTMKSILLFLVVPVICGMTVRVWRRQWAVKWMSPVATTGFVLLILVSPILVWDYFVELDGVVAAVTRVVAILFVIMIPLGYALGKFTGLVEADRRSITVEIGVQNVALALYLSITFFKDISYVIVPIAYLILMWIFVPGFIVVCRTYDRRVAVA